MIIKLPQRTESIYNNEHLFNYLLELESTQKLDTLPVNLMVYHVLTTFANEVDNGGVEQYISNSSKQTYVYLRKCGELLEHPAFSTYISKVCDYFDAALPLDLEFESDVIEALDQEFYRLDKEHDFSKAIDAFYRSHFSVEKIDVPKIKERESDSCRYFVIPKEMTCCDTEQAIDSLLKVLGDFSEQSWRVELWNFFDTYRIIAHSYEKAIDLDSVLLNWDNSNFSFSGQQSRALADRFRLCSYFNGISIISGTDGISQYAVKINASGFAKNEKKMKYLLLTMGRAYDTEICEIHIGDMSHKKDPEKYQTIKKYLEEHYSEYPNIETVFESGEYLN